MSNCESSGNHMVDPLNFERGLIHNIWDRDANIREARHNLKSITPEAVKELNESGHSLLVSEDPYMVKLGVQMLRLCMPHDVDIARNWVVDDAPKLLNHNHPRVRHSSLWNARSAVWVDPSVAPLVLDLAKNALLDEDPAVQRVAIWAHGDSVINEPELFEPALIAIQDYLKMNRGETAMLFALEEFFIPLRELKNTSEYDDAIREIDQGSQGMIGLKARVANLLQTPLELTKDDVYLAHERVMLAAEKFSCKELVKSKKYSEAIDLLLDESSQNIVFDRNMLSVWLIRELLWLDTSNAGKVFSSLKELVLKNHDGDLIRTASVVLGDCLIIAPGLVEEAVQFVNDFYDVTDNDGSQIVVAQTLSSLATASNEYESQLSDIIAEIMPRASNSSVLYTLKLLAR